MRLAFCVLPVEVVMRKIVSKTVAEKVTKIDTPTQGHPLRRLVTDKKTCFPLGQELSPLVRISSFRQAFNAPSNSIMRLAFCVLPVEVVMKKDEKNCE
jgi:hypothetical protein